jgi:NAD(P)H-flavin reductase/ferredoxin
MLSRFFSKQPKLLTINGSNTIVMQAKETILQAALRVDIAFPHSCRVGGCAGCKCQLKEGKVRELTESSYVLSSQELSQGYILACQAVPKENVEISVALDTPEHAFEVLTLAGQVTKQWKLTGDIIALQITLASNMPYASGQYANLGIPGLTSAQRSYSFASAFDKATNQVQFYIKQVTGGALSPVVHERSLVGENIVLDGPHGNFYLRENDMPIVCIAGGSGLAPVKALLEQAVKDNVKRDVTFVFGARTQQDLYCLTEIENISKKWPANFTFIPVLSDEPETSNWQGERGYVTNILPNFLTGNEQAYLCGPPTMIDLAVQVLRNYSVPNNQIYFDKFISLADIAA